MNIKAVQLDLARQKERLDYVLAFIDRAAAWGFNTVVLYLEGRIRTKSFPYLPDDATYTEADIERMVDRAVRQGIDAIPVVSALGHMEQFLQRPELSHLAESAATGEGRLFDSGRPHNLCPTHPDAHAFLRQYLGEVARLFPSAYFHAGFDEHFDLGWCPRCRERAHDEGSAAGLLADHVAVVRGMLADSGKTTMIWDDLFEIWPEALDRIPRDVVLCAWHYDYFVPKPMGHFLHRGRADKFAAYDKLGQPYLLCTYPWNVTNVASFTRYGGFYKPLGALVTNWERSRSFNEVSFPIFDFAGRLWKAGRGRPNDTDALMDEVAADTIPKASPDARRAFAEFYHAPVKEFEYPLWPDRFYGEVLPVEHQRARHFADLAERLEPLAGTNPIVDDMATTLREKLLRYRIRAWLTGYLHGSLADRQWPDRKPLVQDIRDLEQRRLAQWARHREGLPSDALTEAFATLQTDLKALANRIDASTYFLMIRLFLPDRYSLPKLDITAIDERGGEIAIARRATLKPLFDETPYYEMVFPFNSPRYPAALRLESYGFGGQGVAHARILSKAKVRGRVIHWAPEAVRRCDGVVANPTHLFTDNLQWAWLGEHDTARGFRWNDHSRIKHTLELAMGKRE